MSEPRDVRLRRLHMRSIRRGIKEMDLILGAYARSHLPRLTGAELDTYEALLSENDQDLFSWVSGQHPPPERFAGLISELTAQPPVGEGISDT